VTGDLADPDLSPSQPRGLARPVMLHHWGRVGFLHWAYEPDAVQALLPDGLVADTFDGAAWIGLIPFHLRVRRPAWAPSIPWAASTLEANVRTYVRGPDGGPGIWFLSLDASRLLATITARAWYRIPHTWGQMSFRSDPGEIEYRSRRRWPGSPRARMRARLRLKQRMGIADLRERDQFLICRWRLYSPVPGGLAVTQVEHEPWPLHEATPVVCQEGTVGRRDPRAGCNAALPLLPRRDRSFRAPGCDARFRCNCCRSRGQPLRAPPIQGPPAVGALCAPRGTRGACSWSSHEDDHGTMCEATPVSRRTHRAR